MTPMIPQATPAHRAALTLHALSAPDRAWVLQGLPGEQQELLNVLLHELEELGIPRDPELAGALPEEHEPVDHAPAALLRNLDGAGVGRLCGVLAAEPPRLAAALLASGPWPWREQLLRELTLAAGHDVQRLAPATAAARLLQEAVVSELTHVLLEARRATALPSRWQWLRQRLRPWRAAR